jgi:dihydrolipoamide dehydrogenase
LKEFQVVIIGSGPGGYVAAVRAGMLGLKTAIVEKDPVLGGTCLHRGCIPTKALLHTAYLYDEIKLASDHGLKVSGIEVDFPKVHRRKAAIVDKLAKGVQYLMKKRKVEVFTGFGSFVDANTVKVMGAEGDEKIKGQYIIIATGSVPAALPHIKPDHKMILDSDSILKHEVIPKSLAVIGAGAVGVEFASIFRSFGAKVTIIEMLPNIVPLEDEEVSKNLARVFKKKGMDIHTGSEVTKIDKKKAGATLTVKTGDSETKMEAEKVLLAIGRRPVTEEIGLDKIGIESDKGYIPINEFMQTAVPNIYAIGDIVRTPLLAHTAHKEGILAVDHLAGKPAHPIDYKKNPNATYCEPEVASVGLTEREARDQGYKVKVSKFPFSAIGKAMILGETDGFVKIVGEETYDEVLGVHVIGPKATELIAEAVVGLNLEMTSAAMAHSIHAHPTLSEAMMEAAEGVYSEAIHI